MNGSEKDPASKRTSGGRRLAILLVFAGFGASLLTAYIRREGEFRALEQAFAADAATASSLIRKEVSDYLDVLNSVALLPLVSLEINDFAKFQDFVQKGMFYQQRTLGIFGLAPRVEGGGRKEFEQAMQAAGRTGYQIVEYHDDLLSRAPERPFYFPVSYVAPESFAAVPPGLDLSADMQRYEAMNAAAIQGRIRSAGWLNAGGRMGILMVSPIIPALPGALPAPAIEWVHGFTFAVLFPDVVIARALRMYASSEINLSVKDDLSGDVIFPPGAHAADSERGALVYSERIGLADLNWEIICVPAEDFIRSRLTAVPWFYLVGGALLTLILAGQIMHLAGRAEQVRRLVDERTAELRQANERLEAEIKQRHELQRQVIHISTHEKARVGRDLHDSLGQQLTGIGLLASGLARALAPLDATCAEQARLMAEQLKEARRAARRIAHGLTPVELDAEGLATALEKMMEEMSGAGEIRFETAILESPDIQDHDAATHAYLIMQEAVNNAVRHGSPTCVRLVVQKDRLILEDDGGGLPPGDRRVGGLGLSIMRYRAEMAGATLTLRSRYPHGTVVELVWHI